MKTLFVFSSLGSYIVPAAILILFIMLLIFLRDWRKYITHLERTSPMPGFANAFMCYLSAKEAREKCKGSFFPWKFLFWAGYIRMANDCQEYAGVQLDKIKDFIDKENSFNFQWDLLFPQLLSHTYPYPYPTGKKVKDLKFPNLAYQSVLTMMLPYDPLYIATQEKIKELFSKYVFHMLRTTGLTGYSKFSDCLKTYYDLGSREYREDTISSVFHFQSLIRDLIKEREKEITERIMCEINQLEQNESLKERIEGLESIQLSFVFRHLDPFIGYGSEGTPRDLIRKVLVAHFDEVYALAAKETSGETRDQYLEKITDKKKE